RLQRWLSDVSAQIRDSRPQQAMASSRVDGSQLELFAQEFFAALKPSDKPAPPAQPLFRAPPPAPRHLIPAPPVADGEPPLKRIVLGAHTVDYALRRSARRSIGFMIDDDGLRVTAPRRCSQLDIDNAIRAKQRWILTKLLERGERRAQRQERVPVEWKEGARLPYLGGEITLRLEQAVRSHCQFDAGNQELWIGVVPGLSEWQLKERIRLWFQAEATRLFKERLDHYAPRLGVAYQAFALSSAGTRWGSCTVEGKIRLNWRLVHYPLALVDYVVAHELAHLREMNHSPQFWATVGEVYPDYDGARRALKKRAHEMPVLFTD
ncbi:MAG: M48 family metallopeptidase, partial [Telluria sp.]